MYWQPRMSSRAQRGTSGVACTRPLRSLASARDDMHRFCLSCPPFLDSHRAPAHPEPATEAFDFPAPRLAHHLGAVMSSRVSSPLALAAFAVSLTPGGAALAQ